MAAAAAVYFLGIRPRQRSEADAAGLARAAGRPSVNVIIAARAPPRSGVLSAPGGPAGLRRHGDPRPGQRLHGGKWLVDIGDHVKAGQTLAVIDSPEIDQELRQARANLEVAKANRELARVTADRWKSLEASTPSPSRTWISRVADCARARPTPRPPGMAMQRLEEMQQFETVTAPFDGVISVRNIDVGALISAGSGPELFHISQSGTLRVYVNVPQAYVPDMKVGLPVDVLVDEFPGENFPGKIVRYAGALDAASRTLLVEVQIPNAKAELFPGMFCRLRFRLPSDPAILIPSNDAIIRAEGTLVAVVTPENTLHFQKVSLGRDFGTQIEVRAGLAEGSHIVDNPGDALSEGLLVTPVLPAAKVN